MTDRDPLYRLAQWFARTTWRALAGLQVEGLHHVPGQGPFLLICNHQSNLDPILIHAVCPRAVHAMAKSTQFTAPVVGSIMRRFHSFPVRRYQTDPQAARVALRRLRAGLAVAIYVEGERTWDGRLQPPKLGTLRLALKAGVPIIPCTILGAYAAWPRWSRQIQRLPIRVRFGPAFHLPQLDRRADREPALPLAASAIMGALAAQLEEPLRPDLTGAQREVTVDKLDRLSTCDTTLSQRT